MTAPPFTNFPAPLRMESSLAVDVGLRAYAEERRSEDPRAQEPSYASNWGTYPPHELRGRHQCNLAPYQLGHRVDDRRRAQTAFRVHARGGHRFQSGSSATGKGALVARVSTIAVIGAG